MITFDGDRINFDPSRCANCGLCLSSCAKGALTERRASDGTLRLDWDSKSCSRCQLCVKYCPASDLPKYTLTAETWTSCRGAWLAASTDKEMRRNSSSGGVGRTLIQWALSSASIDGVWCVARAEDGNIQGRLLSKKDDIKDVVNSQYRPIDAVKGLPRLPRGAHLMVVGTNCQLQAATRFYQGSGVDLTLIGILCKQQKTLSFSEYLRRRLGASENAPIQFRGDGWPGKIVCGSKTEQFDAAAGFVFGKALWRVPGCRVCAHPTGYQADLTLADPWGIGRPQDHGNGRSLVLVWNTKGASVLNACASSLALQQLPVESAMASVDWTGIQRKQERHEYHLGNPPPLHRRIYYGLGEVQRRLYELALGWAPRMPALGLRILGRLPFLG